MIDQRGADAFMSELVGAEKKKLEIIEARRPDADKFFLPDNAVEAQKACESNRAATEEFYDNLAKSLEAEKKRRLALDDDLQYEPFDIVMIGDNGVSFAPDSIDSLQDQLADWKIDGFKKLAQDIRKTKKDALANIDAKKPDPGKFFSRDKAKEANDAYEANRKAADKFYADLGKALRKEQKRRSDADPVYEPVDLKKLGPMFGDWED